MATKLSIAELDTAARLGLEVLRSGNAPGTADKAKKILDASLDLLAKEVGAK